MDWHAFSMLTSCWSARIFSVLVLVDLVEGPRVYAWGRYTSGAIPSGDGTPTLIAASGSLLGGGARHLVAAAAPNDGGVYGHTIITVGSNTYQQLGAKSSVLVPGGTFVADNLDLVAAASSRPHCFAYDAACAALGMDACADGGCIPLSDPTVGSRLSKLETAQLSAGEEHTLLLTRSGEVWGWGRNLEGQLGSSALVAPIVPPSRLPIGVALQQDMGMGRAVYVGAGHFKSAVVVGGRLQVSVGSEGLMDSWNSNGEAPAHFGLRATVELAGVQVFDAQAMRGHVVVVLDQYDGTVITRRQYNTHDSDEADARQFIADIAELPDGRIVVVATAENGATHSGLITEALRSLGADAKVDPGEYGTFAFVGVAGYSGEQWVVQGSSAPGEGPTTITASVPLAGYPGPSEVYVAGYNGYGEFGRSVDDISDVPAAAGFALATSLSHLGVVAIEFGREHAAVLTGGGALFGIGSNEGGQLGVGSTSLCTEGRECTTATPMQSRADGLLVTTGFESIATGDHHTLALSSGRVYCAGLNAHGECGLGHRDLVDEFHRVPGLSNIVSVAAGARHSLALNSDGTVFGWGWNYHGQLGQEPDGASGGSHFELSPVEMAGAGTAIAVAAGELYSAAAVG
jgi:hypothetical protein